jgi:hypothetical protein
MDNHHKQHLLKYSFCRPITARLSEKAANKHILAFERIPDFMQMRGSRDFETIWETEVPSTGDTTSQRDAAIRKFYRDHDKRRYTVVGPHTA